VKDLNVQKMTIVHTFWPVLMRNVLTHANALHQHNVLLEIMCHLVNVQPDTQEILNNHVQLFLFKLIHNVVKMLIALVNMPVSMVFVGILVTRQNHVQQMQSVLLSILFH
jgi:hypothetical protein